MTIKPKTTHRWWLRIWMLLIAVSGGLVFSHAFVGDDEGESDLLGAEIEQPTEDAPEPELLETNSLFPEARIVAASWRRDPARAHDGDAEEEPNDAWYDMEAESRKQRERALREVVKQTGGLAIHVAQDNSAKDR